MWTGVKGWLNALNFATVFFFLYNGFRFAVRGTGGETVVASPAGAFANSSSDLYVKEVRIMDRPGSNGGYSLLGKETPEKAPCQQDCPLGIDIPRYLRLTADRKFAEAASVVREKNPFPSICGRVCFNPCELHCPVAQIDGAVMIRALERVAAQQDGVLGKPKAKATGKKVAVVGSGPAGLTAAYYLAKKGHSVTVFEALPYAGGMLRVGIPEYRLPKTVLDNQIEMIKSAGVDIKTNSRIDSVDRLVKQGYQAVFLALGAHRPVNLGIPGEDTPGVIPCLAFLRDANQGKKVKVGKRVAVIGGGNAAIDAARMALRAGSREVTVVYRRRQEDMPADQPQVSEALAEGVKFQFLAAPARITKEVRSINMECVRMKPGRRDKSGRPRPQPIAGSGFTLKLDTVISAVGEMPEITADLGVGVKKEGTIKVDTETLATNKAGVFAGGDAVTGPASVTEAIAAGKRAAISIDKYLGGTGNIDEVLAAPEGLVAPWEPVSAMAERIPAPSLPVEQRLSGFGEVELGLEEKAAVEQASRCLRCDLPIMIYAVKCSGCLVCQLRCSFRWEKVFNLSKASIKVHRLFRDDVQYALSFTDKCDSCGVCVRYCAYGALTREKASVS